MKRLWLLCIVLGSVASQDRVCPLPTSPLLQRLDLATCQAGDRPAPPAQTVSVASKETSLPSFDEWKEKHAEEEVRKPAKKVKPQTADDTMVESASDRADDPSRVTSEATPAAETPSDAGEMELQQTETALSTTSYVHPLPNSGSGLPDDPMLPLRSRNNYASQDCAASILQSSKTSKHASSVLNSKKDRYMLTPCNADPKYIIVELCEEIDIDTLVIANWEFFSSMFKLFRVLVSEVYPGGEDDWKELGIFRAGNLRGSQVFRPKKRGGFHRYIRLDFLTHYGTEYYCPVSLLEVYGRTQMESFRDEERARQDANRVAQALLADEESSATEEESSSSTTLEKSPVPTLEASIESDSASAVTSETTLHVSVLPPLATEVLAESSIAASSAKPTNGPLILHSSDLAANFTSASLQATSAPAGPEDKLFAASESTVHPPTSLSANTTKLKEQPSRPGNASSSEMLRSTTTAASPINATTINGNRNARNETRSSTTSIASATGASAESIYGTIMKRITALEKNATLGSKYIEEHRKLVSSSIAKLEKSFAASEASRKQDSQLIRRLILDFDLHRARLEEERQTLSAQVTVLANEIVFERRLGLAQLLALLVLLAFVTLTRGSSVPLVSLPAHRSRWSSSPTDLMRHKSLDRPRRVHTSLPADKTLSRSSPMLPRAPPARRSLGISLSAPVRNHRRARSLTPPLSELEIRALDAGVVPSPLAWVSSGESDAEEPHSHRTSVSLEHRPLLDMGKGPPSSQSSPEVTTPTLADALRPITLNT